MTVAAPSIFRFDNSFVRDLPEMYQPWLAVTAPEPRLLAFDDDLAGELGADPQLLRSTEGVAVLVGNVVPDGAAPVAQAYAGHQFGGYSPRLGDGRALLVGEIIDRDGHRRDLHLKGSGRTPFARGGDGLAAVGPMLREYVVSRAMHRLGVPTTRALAVVATGGDVHREVVLPGAVLARVASSHLRVGSFEYAAANGGPELVRRLADHAIARHHPDAAAADSPYLALLGAVADAQAALVAHWMSIGFVHGVMNTDNVTISGETIDYGPCAFMDRYDPATVFSSIDHGGRYAYGNQPTITLWNLARFAESLLVLLDDDTDAAVAAATRLLEEFPARYQQQWTARMSAKLGLAVPAGDPGSGPSAADSEHGLVVDWLDLLAAQGADFTLSHRALSSAVRGDRTDLRSAVGESPALDDWLARWSSRLEQQGGDAEVVAASMERVNPRYIPRNHLVEEALDAATLGDLGPFDRLVHVLDRPFEDQPGAERHAAPAPDGNVGYRTFCGT